MKPGLEYTLWKQVDVVGRLVESEMVMVPNGRWIVEVIEQWVCYTHDLSLCEEGCEHRQQVMKYSTIGIDSAQLTRYRVGYGVERCPTVTREWSHHVLVADQPFVVLGENEIEQSRWVQVARQVHKGELGKEPFLNTPKFIRGPRGWGWVKLVDLARFASMTADEVWRHFSRFSGSGGMTVLFARRDAAAVTQDAKDLKWGTHIMTPLTDWLYFTTPEAERADIWVPAGWARRVLYLIKFGYKAEGSKLEVAAKDLRMVLECLKTDSPSHNKEGTMNDREYTTEDEARNEEFAVRRQMEQERIAERDARGMVVDTDDDCPDCGHTHRECVCNKEAP